MAAIQNAGLALEWVRKVLGVSWKDVYEEAFAVPPGSGGVTFLPYLSGERTPRFDPGARGAWTGLGLDHTRGHLLRAALEGVAFALREGLEALEDLGISAPELRLAGGGASGDPEARAIPGGSYWPTCSAARCGCCQMRSPPSHQPVAPLFWPASPPVSIPRPRTRSPSPPSPRDHTPRRARPTRPPTNATRNSTPGSTVE